MKSAKMAVLKALNGAGKTQSIYAESLNMSYRGFLGEPEQA
jgi:hypothetical protein